jgi:uncharacterized delta-60 repeat protein
MKKPILAFLVYSLILSAKSIFAQSGSIDSTFNVNDNCRFGDGSGFTSEVLSTDIQTDGKIVVGGSFTTFNGSNVNRIARLNIDGTLDTSFNAAGLNLIFVVLVQPDGKILAGGNSGGGLVRYNTDGTPDPSFNIGTGFSRLPSPDSGLVKSLALQSDGKILVGGNFTTFNGTSRNCIVRLNINGTLDTGFNPGTGFNGEVRSIAIQTDGKILVGGDFTSFNGAVRNYIARLNTNGTNDTGFNIGTGFNQGFPGAGTVHSIRIQSNGAILVGGDFTTFNSISINRLARLNINGTLDIGFNPGSTFNQIVYGIAIQPDGKIIACGGFWGFKYIVRCNTDGSLDLSFDTGNGSNSTIKTVSLQPDGKIITGGGFSTFDGFARGRIARLNSSGSLDKTFGGTSGFNGNVNVIVIQSNNKIVVGGSFSSYNDTIGNKIVRLNIDGSVDTSFNSGTGSNQGIDALVALSNGKYLIGGNFTTYNGSTRNRIARLNANGSLDAAFYSGTGFNGQVNTISVQSNGSYIIGGTFLSFDGIARNRIVRLDSNGVFDASFNPGSGLNSTVNTTAIQPDGKVLAGGDFTNFNGVTNNRIVRLNFNGSLDVTFNIGSGFNGSVYSIVIQPDGKILVAGNFTTFNGITRNRIVRLNSDGTYDSTFNPGTGFNGLVWDIKLQPDGMIVVAGNFTSFNGITRNKILRLLPNGSLDLTLSVGSGPGMGNTTDLAIQSDGKILVGGGFTSFNGICKNRIVRLNACLNPTSIDTIISCGPYTWIDGNTYSSNNNSASIVLSNSIGCDSIVTLNLTINPPPPAPTGSLSQVFCNSGSVSNLSATGTTGSTIQWYSTINGGIPLLSSTTLTNGATYYASQTINNCESSSRLAVTVNISSTPAPSGSNIQTFCTGTTIAELVTNGINIQWYSSPIGGALISPNTLLVSGVTYYASQTLNSCESINRLAVLVNVTALPQTPVIIPNSSLTFCIGQGVTLTANQSNNIIWSTGETTSSINIYSSGNYSFTVNNGICPPIVSQPVTVIVENPDVQILASGPLAENLPNTSITFTASASCAGSITSYIWYKNGLQVGTNSSSYTNNNWTNGDKIVCRMTTNSGFSVFSNDLFVWLAQSNQDSWQRMADVGLDKNLITKRFPNRTGAICFAIGNKIYVGLGYSVNSPVLNYNSEYLSDFWEYNTATDEWTERASFAYGNSPRINSSCFTLNGKAYVIGGIDAFGTYKNDVWEYDPQIDSWTQKSNFPGAARHSATAASVFGIGYFGTGWSFNNNNLKDWWSYDSNADSWTQQASLTTPTTDNFATTSSVVEGNIYLVGANYTCAYDVLTNSWIQKPTLPANLYYAKSFGIDSFLYVIGGQESPFNNNPCAGIKTKNSVWQLNLNTNIWVRKTDIILGNSSNGSLAVVDQKAYFISGGFGQACQASSYFNFGGGSESALMIYDPIADSWQLGSPLGGIKPSFGFSATIGNKGYALVQYSFNSSSVVGFTNSYIYMFEYDPLNNTWKQKSRYPGSGNMHVGGGFVLNNKIYYGSGQDYNFNYTTDFWEYNPQTDSWSNIGNIPIGITKPFTFTLHNKGYMGGSNMGNSFFEFNPSTFTWTQRASIPMNPQSTLHFSLGNFGYVGAVVNTTTSELFKYDPLNNMWQSMGLLPFNNPLFSFQNNNFGYCGYNTNQSTSTIYEYNQSNNNWTNKMGLPKISGNNFTSFNFSSNSFVFGGSEPINTTSTALFPVNDLWQYRPSSQITALESDIIQSNNYKIYPNPVKDMLNLEVDPSYIGLNYKIVDVLGREVLNGTINEQINRIDLQDLVPGIYILFGEKESIKYKIVKE